MAKQDDDRYSQMAASAQGASQGAQYFSAWQDSVQKVIDESNRSFREHLRANHRKDVPNLAGELFEQHHASTFNIDSAANRSDLKAEVPKSNKAGSSDIDISRNGEVVDRYQAKAWKTPKDTANSASDGRPGVDGYKNQKKIVPEDQLDGVKDHAGKQAKRNATSRPEQAENYEHTKNNATDHIEYEGNRSRPISKEEIHQRANDAKQGEEAPHSYKEDVRGHHRAREIGKAALTAAAISVMMEALPAMLEAFTRLMNEEGYTVEVMAGEAKVWVKEKGAYVALDTFASSVLAGMLQDAAASGKFGDFAKGLAPDVFASVAVIAWQCAKAFVQFKRGKITFEEATDCSFKATLMVVSTAVGRAIGNSLFPLYGGLIGGTIAARLVSEGIKAIEDSDPEEFERKLDEMFLSLEISLSSLIDDFPGTIRRELEFHGLVLSANLTIGMIDARAALKQNADKLATGYKKASNTFSGVRDKVTGELSVKSAAASAKVQEGATQAKEAAASFANRILKRT